MRALLLLVLLSMPALAAAAAEPAPGSLVGTWGGPVEASEVASVPQGETIGMTLSGGTGGFTVRWKVPLLGVTEASFAPTARPGVYAVKAGGMFSLFGSRGPGNPLDGQQLLWARTDGPTLVVYGFEVAKDGAFNLARFECARDGDEVSVRYSRRVSGAGEQPLTARLSRLGG